MTKKLWLILIPLFMLIATLCWGFLNLALENDGLRQVANGHKESVQTLLSYVKVATRCDLTEKELTEELRKKYPEVSSTGGTVSRLSFEAVFAQGRIIKVGIKDVDEINACNQKN